MNTNRKITPSRMTLGTVQLGMAYGIVGSGLMPDTQSAYDILRTARQGGITTYDTAAMYGQSEQVLGQFFGKVEPDADPIIVSKIYVRPEEGWNAARIEEDVLQQTLLSMDKLRVKRLAVMMLHNADAMRIYGDEIINAFSKIVQEGLVCQAGISLSMNTMEEFQILKPYLQEDVVGAVQLPLNLFDQRPLENGCLELLAGLGKTVYARSIFLQGLLYADETALPSQLPEAREPIHQLRELAEECGLSAAQLAVAYVRDMAGIDSLVIGVQTAGQLEENLRMMEAPQLPDSVRGEIRRRFQALPERLITPKLWK